MRAKDVMTSTVITVGLEADISEVAGILLKHRISGLPVLDRSGAVVGIVSEGDLMRRTKCDRGAKWWLSLVADKSSDYVRAQGTRARDVMTDKVVSIEPDTSLSEVARILETRGIKRVPVIQEGQLVGIVSRADILRGLASVALSSGATPRLEDEAIRGRILEIIKRQTSANLQAISVIVVNSVVYLWGIAETQTDKDAIRIAAENVAGVNKVHDFLNTLPEVLRGIP